MYLLRARSISARTDRIGGARRSQVLTLSCEKMGFVRARLNDSREGASLVRNGSEFQILKAAALNALEPMLVLTCGRAKSCCPCERNAREGTYGCIKLAKYAGELCCSSLNVSVTILMSVRCLTGSQCNC